MSIWEAKLSTSGLTLWQQDLIKRILLSPRFKDKEDAMKLLLVLLANYSVPHDKSDFRKEIFLATQLPKPKKKQAQKEAQPVQPEKKQEEEPHTTARKVEEDRKRIASMIRILRQDIQKYFTSEGRHEAWDIQIEQVSKLVRFFRRYVNAVWAPHLPHPETGWEPHELGIVYPEPLFLRPPSSDYFVRHRQLNDKTSSQKKSHLVKEYPFLGNLHSCRHYIGAGDARCMLTLTKWFERKDVRTSHFGASTHKDWKQLTGDSFLLIGNTRTNWTVRDIQDKIKMDVRFAIRNIGIETPKPSIVRDETRPDESKDRTAYGIFLRRRHPSTDTFLTFILVNEGPLSLLLAEYMTDEVKVRELFTKHIRFPDTHELPKEFEIFFSGKLDPSDHSVPRSAVPLGYRLDRGPAFLWNSDEKKYDEIALSPREQGRPSKKRRKAAPAKRPRSTRHTQ